MAEPSDQQLFVPLLFNTRNRIRFAMDEAFKPLGITDATWRTLFYLSQTGDGVTQKELASVMGIEGPSLVRLLDSLEGKHFIERRPNPDDRRAKTVHLTSTGRRRIVEWRTVSARVREKLLAEISAEEIQCCVDVFQRILNASEGEPQ